MDRASKLDVDGEQLGRLRRICFSLPECEEKLSHGEPTFFVRKRVFVMFANNHHNDGHVAVWIPVDTGAQASLIKSAPRIYFNPPYVGVKGWVGVELGAVDEDELATLILNAWRLIAPKSLRAAGGSGRT
jgi:hypothetical protein